MSTVEQETIIKCEKFIGQDSKLKKFAQLNKEANEILNQYPNDITELNISNKNIKGVIDLSKFTHLTKLNCKSNSIKYIILPNKLIEINCGSNKIKALNNLPKNLIKLNCESNLIKQLDKLPNELKKLNCSNNILTSLDKLPNKLEELDCSHNELKSLDKLPTSLIKVTCENNQIRSIYKLRYCNECNKFYDIDKCKNFKSYNLVELNCKNNNLKILDNLPNTLKRIECSYNYIESLDNFLLWNSS